MERQAVAPDYESMYKHTVEREEALRKELSQERSKTMTAEAQVYRYKTAFEMLVKSLAEKD